MCSSPSKLTRTSTLFSLLRVLPLPNRHALSLFSLSCVLCPFQTDTHFRTFLSLACSSPSNPTRTSALFSFLRALPLQNRHAPTHFSFSCVLCLFQTDTHFRSFLSPACSAPSKQTRTSTLFSLMRVQSTRTTSKHKSAYPHTGVGAAFV